MSSQKSLSESSSCSFEDDSSDVLIPTPVPRNRGVGGPRGSPKWHCSKLGLGPCHALLAIIFTLLGFSLAQLGRIEPIWRGQDSDLVFCEF